MSVYSEATIGLSPNIITFNKYTDFPVYRTQTRTPVQFQMRSDDIPVPFESGINDWKTLIGQSIYVIKGTMYPRDEATYYSGMAALRAACSVDLQQDNPQNDDSGYVPYTWKETSDSKTLFVKALYVQMSEDTRQGYVQPFTIYCKVKDPIIYGSVAKIASTQTLDPVASTGTAIFPFTYPIVYGATTYATTTTAYNYGNIPSYPVSIVVKGPITNPKIINSLTGEYIQVNVTLGNSSNILRLEYDNSQLTVTVDGNSVVSSVATGSTYFKIQPGGQDITVTGSSIGTGAYAELTYRDSYALA